MPIHSSHLACTGCVTTVHWASESRLYIYINIWFNLTGLRNEFVHIIINFQTHCIKMTRILQMKSSFGYTFHLRKMLGAHAACLSALRSAEHCGTITSCNNETRGKQLVARRGSQSAAWFLFSISQGPSFRADLSPGAGREDTCRLRDAQ